MLRSRAVAVFPVTLLAASFTCSDANVSAPIQLADDLAAAFCKRQFRCCSTPEIGELAAGRYATEADCLAFAKLSARRMLALLDSAVAAGHVMVDPRLAADCSRKYEEQACANPFQGDPVTALPDVGQILAACPGLLIGRVPAGSRCDLAEECVAGTRCSGGSSAVPPQVAGGGFGGFGGTGLPGSSTGTSVGVCIAAGKLGDICNESADCDAASLLYCKQPEFVCARPAGEGQPCAFDFSGNPTVACDASAGLVCDANRLVCRRLPREGEACVVNFQFSLCDQTIEPGLTCNMISGTCQAPAAAGEACGAAALPPCRFELSCIPTQSDGIGACGPPPGEGEPCRDKCANPTACDNATNRCTRVGPKPTGAECSDNTECLSLACLDLGTGTRRCVSSARRVVCAGGDATFSSGFGGFGGTLGRAGTSGFAGSFMTGFGGAAGVATGGGGEMGGSSGPAGTFGGAATSGASGTTGASGMTGAAGVTGAGGTGG